MNHKNIHSYKKTKLFFIALITFYFQLSTFQLYGQYGFGTNQPSDSSVIHIVSPDSSQGVILPFVTSITRPGAAANIKGMLVYNLTDSAIQYCDGLQWVTLHPDSLSDHDFYEVGTTSPPDNINDNIFTQGNVGIATTSPANKLHIGFNTNETFFQARSGVRSLTLTGPDVSDSSTPFIFNTNNNYVFRTDANNRFSIYEGTGIGVGPIYPPSALIHARASNIDSYPLLRIEDRDAQIRLILTDTGLLDLPSYGQDTLIGSPSTMAAFDTDGDVIEVDFEELADSIQTFVADHDFYKAGTTTVPDNINDDIYTNGNMGIGVSNPQEDLHILGGGNARLDNGYLLMRTNGRIRMYNPANSNFSEIYNSATGGTTELRFNTGIVDAMILDGQGNLGLNTTAPARKFHIHNDITGADSSFVVTVRGNVGVGTTNPNSKLHVVQETGNYITHLQGTGAGAESYLGQIAANSNYVLFSGSGGRLGGWKPDGSFVAGGVSSNNLLDGTFHVDGTNNEVGINTGNPSAVFHIHNDVTGADSAFVVTAAGNVGVGTTNPFEKLEVKDGSVHVEYTSSSTSSIGNNAFYTTNGSGSGFGFGTFSNNWTYVNSYGGPISFQLHTGNDVLFRGSGNVGINNISPTNKLHISATSDPIKLEGLVHDVSLDTTIVVDAEGVLHKRSLTSIADSIESLVADHDFYEVGTLTSPDAITDNVFTQGNVSIGTETNSDRLHVYGTLRLDGATSAYGTINYSSGTNSLDQRLFAGGTNYNFYIDDNDGFKFDVGGNERVRIEPGGNVGIGTPSPSEKLEVYNGNVLLGVDNPGLGSNKRYMRFNNSTADDDAVLELGTPSLTNGNFIGVLIQPTHTNAGQTMQGIKVDFPKRVYANYKSYGFFMEDTVGSHHNIEGIHVEVTREGGLGNHNNYAGYFAARTDNGLAYGLYSKEGLNYFGDNVGVGTTLPQEELQVIGSGRFGRGGNRYNLVYINDSITTDRRAILEVTTATTLNTNMSGILVNPKHTNSGQITGVEVDLPTIVKSNTQNYGFFIDDTVSATANLTAVYGRATRINATNSKITKGGYFYAKNDNGQALSIHADSGLVRLTDIPDSIETDVLVRAASGNIYKRSISSIADSIESLVSDHDWYEVGTTYPPNAITDNMYTNGNVGIGTNAPNGLLQVVGDNDATIDTAFTVYNNGDFSAGFNDPQSASTGLFYNADRRNLSVGSAAAGNRLGNTQGNYSLVMGSLTGSMVGEYSIIAARASGFANGTYLHGTANQSIWTGSFNNFTANVYQGHTGSYNELRGSAFTKLSGTSTINYSSIVSSFRNYTIDASMTHTDIRAYRTYLKGTFNYASLYLTNHNYSTTTLNSGDGVFENISSTFMRASTGDIDSIKNVSGSFVNGAGLKIDGADRSLILGNNIENNADDVTILNGSGTTRGMTNTDPFYYSNSTANSFHAIYPNGFNFATSVSGSAMNNGMRLKSDHTLQLLDYGDTTHTGSIATMLATDDDGNVIETSLSTLDSLLADNDWTLDADTLYSGPDSTVVIKGGNVGIGSTEPVYSLDALVHPVNGVRVKPNGIASQFPFFKLVTIADNEIFRATGQGDIIMTTAAKVSIANIFNTGAERGRIQINTLAGGTPIGLVNVSGSSVQSPIFVAKNNDTDTVNVIEARNSLDDKLFVVNSLGNVGIGTSNPMVPLQISRVAQEIDNGFAATINLDQSLAIADYDDAKKIVFESQSSTSDLYTGGIHFTRRAINLQGNHGSGIRGKAGNTILQSNVLEFYTSTFGERNLTRMLIDQNGNIGVNETSPQEIFHIDANADSLQIDNLASGTLDNVLMHDPTTGKVITGTVASLNDNDWIIDGDTLYSGPDSTVVIREGKVGIGVMDPTANLTVLDEIKLNGTSPIINFFTSQYYLQRSGTTMIMKSGATIRMEAPIIHFKSASTDYGRWNSTGLGIGTINPEEILHIDANADSLQIDNLASGTLDNVLMHDPATGKVVTGTVSSVLNSNTITSVSGNYTALSTDDIVLVDASGGDVTITLPLVANNNGKVLRVKKDEGSANNVVIDGNGAETIDGSTSQTTNVPWTGWVIACNGSKWSIVGRF